MENEGYYRAAHFAEVTVERVMAGNVRDDGSSELAQAQVWATLAVAAALHELATKNQE